MKKLIITLSAIAVAVITQAATVNWASGAFKTPATTDGGWSDTTITSGSVAGYLFMLDAATYGTLNSTDIATVSQNVYDSFGTKLGDADATKNTGTSMILTDGAAYSAGDSIYAALLYIYTDGSNEYYLGNVGTVTLASNQNKNMTNMALKLNSTGDSMTSVGWTAVPEPTSGLLLLLGVAGLALKRKRA